jgi:3-deoxy-7-phosphoheptulonate synthase
MSIKNIRIRTITPLLSPDMVMHKLPLPIEIERHVKQSRLQIARIIDGSDARLLAIVGPCSIHDSVAALEYARKLKKLADKLKDRLCIVMRVYFEKPRTTVGWKGLINDPHLDNSFAINDGLLLAREILLEINNIGLSTATEFVDTITPQYIADLVGWAAIGARTTESQPHRMLASGLSMPVGFKNNTAGDIKSAINATLSAQDPHRFLSVTEQGIGAIVVTEGNDQCHIILRGGTGGPNYSAHHVQEASRLLAQNNLNARVIVDCSHDNCDKDYQKQKHVVDNICQQLQSNDDNIMGFMLESNLKPGKQALNNKENLVYGQSITDGCVDWHETEELLHKIAYSCVKEKV